MNEAKVVKQAFAIFFQANSFGVVASTKSIFGMVREADVGE
jgi:hypothetical protein